MWAGLSAAWKLFSSSFSFPSRVLLHGKWETMSVHLLLLTPTAVSKTVVEFSALTFFLFTIFLSFLSLNHALACVLLCFCQRLGSTYTVHLIGRSTDVFAHEHLFFFPKCPNQKTPFLVFCQFISQIGAAAVRLPVCMSKAQHRWSCCDSAVSDLKNTNSFFFFYLSTCFVTVPRAFVLWWSPSQF